MCINDLHKEKIPQLENCRSNYMYPDNGSFIYTSFDLSNGLVFYYNGTL